MAWVETGAVLFAVAYLLLAIRQIVWCWLAAIISVVLSFFLFRSANLIMEAYLQVFYLGMAFFGWYQWTRGSSTATVGGISVRWWPTGMHLLAVTLIVGLSLAFGHWLSGTDAASPYVDSFTTVGAIVATWMVARKIIENWIYWFVIDGVSVWLYLSRDLWGYAGL